MKKHEEGEDDEEERNETDYRIWLLLLVAVAVGNPSIL
tara:strand:- start:252 stop:365 length:114 start_codon:yes stop_codon:yes gene_type:complete